MIVKDEYNVEWYVDNDGTEYPISRLGLFKVVVMKKGDRYISINAETGEEFTLPQENN